MENTASRGRPPRLRQHRWVAAALVDVGFGDTGDRAARAARSGRYVVPAGTRLEVLEIYCGDCRVPYSSRVASERCEAAAGAMPAPRRLRDVAGPRPA